MTSKLEQHLVDGWELINETKEYYILQRKKPFSLGWLLFWLFTTFFGAFIYVVYHFTKKPKTQLLNKREE